MRQRPTSRCRLGSALEHRVQQDIRARLDPFLRRILDFVVTDAVDARHEHHRRRRDLRQIARVVSRARHHVAMRIAETFGGSTHGLHASRIERDGRVVEDLFELRFKPDAARDLRHAFAQLGVHLREHGVVGMTEVDGEEHASGNHVARVRMDLHHADRRASERRMIEADAVHEIDHARRAEQRVAAARHRRRARVRFLARSA